MNYPTREHDPGADPAPAMDDTPTIRGGGGQPRGGSHGHRADAGPELTRRAVGPRLYHKKSRMGCLRCKARRVKVSFICPLCHVYSMPRSAAEWGGCVTRADGGHYICTSYYSSRSLFDLLLFCHSPALHTHIHSPIYSTSFDHLDNQYRGGFLQPTTNMPVTL